MRDSMAKVAADGPDPHEFEFPGRNPAELRT